MSAASVSRWQALECEQSDVRPKALGGDRKSGRIDAHEATIVEALGPEADRSIEEVRFGALQRFFKCHAITRKKRPRTPGSKIVPTL